MKKMPLPKKTKYVAYAQFTTRIDGGLHERFKKKCVKDGYSMSELVTHWIEEFTKTK